MVDAASQRTGCVMIQSENGGPFTLTLCTKQPHGSFNAPEPSLAVGRLTRTNVRISHFP